MASAAGVRTRRAHRSQLRETTILTNDDPYRRDVACHVSCFSLTLSFEVARRSQSISTLTLANIKRICKQIIHAVTLPFFIELFELLG